MDYIHRKDTEKHYEEISPFEFKNKLIELAEKNKKKRAYAMLNAGRGNPNWIAATPREAFFTLGQFAVSESRRVWDQGDLAGMPARKGIAERLEDYLSHNANAPGRELLQQVIRYGVEVKGFDADAFVHELVDGIVGDNYPVPDRMLVRVEQIVHDFIVQEMCEGDQSLGRFQLFATEGATAAMCYVFDSLIENYLLEQGGKIAIMVPIFTPYVEIPQLHRYSFDVVEIYASAMDQDGYHTWQYPDSELAKLRDKRIKALFLVNPSNPPSVAMDPKVIQKIIEIVKNDNPNLMIISDDVYGTFVDRYRSLMADLPYNTIGVYSLSKYFGVTGWRLGVIAVHENNVFDHLLTELSEHHKKILHHRYRFITEHPEEIPFIERMVADSRQVALRHTAGLSTPQQVQMALFAAFALLDKSNRYKNLTREICHRRMMLLYEGLGLPLPNLSHNADYYTEFDIEVWATHHYGQAFTDYLQTTYEPVDVLLRLADESSIILLPGGGFYGPRWSIRVSLANLEDKAYSEIGQDLKRVMEYYVTEWKKQQS